MKQIYIIPRDGLKIRHPETMRIVPEEGMYVLYSLFWSRRKVAGEIEILETKPDDK